MDGCIYRTADGKCEFWSDHGKGVVSYCDFEDCKEKKLSNADRIRSMTDEELAELIGDNIDCAICKEEIFQITTCPGSLTADGKDCYGCWLDWLRQEAE